MADGSLIFDTSINGDGFDKGLAKMKSIAVKGAAAIAAAVSGISMAAIKVGSDFEAAMSEVQAISGATGSDFDALTAKAKEMGATTKFSASESAEALKYMAMAGWDAQQMVDGLDGVMNLAAASGEELGSVSDIVTDALTAFGLKASDSAHFADVLAKASSSSNTNVAMMGATFKYAAPLAGALGYSIEDTALAIGLMANAGIKGEQAGTALRSMFTRLSDPPKEAADAINALGLQMTDTEGNALPLADVLGQLREKFAGLSQEQQIQMASSIAGQEAMSGLLAIVNAGEEDFNKLKNQIANADGAAKEMADTMNDNLQGRIIELKSGLEGLGIQFYDYIKTPLKEAAEAAIDSVQKLSSSLSGGKLGDSVKSLGDSLKNLITTVTKLATSALPPLISAFSWVLKNAGKIAAGLIAVKTAMVMLSVTSKIAAGFKATTEAADALWASLIRTSSVTKILTVDMTAQQVAAHALTGKISLLTAAKALATKAQIALNAAWAANSVGLVVTAVAALAAGLGVLYLTTRDNTDSFQALAEAANESYNAFEEQRTAVADNVSADMAQLDHVQNLADELRTLADENGNVAEKDRERASLIMGELNEALGTEYTMVDGVIQKYDELSGSIDTLIAKKRTEILLDANKESYTSALEAREKESAVTLKLQEELNELSEVYDSLNNKNSPGAAKIAQEMSEVNDKITQSTARFNALNQCISAYEQATALAANGSYDAAEKILSSMSNLSEVANMSADEQAAYYQEQLSLADDLIAHLQEAGATAETIEWWQNWRDGLAESVEEMTGVAAEAGPEIDSAIADSIMSNSGVVAGSAQQLGPLIDGNANFGNYGQKGGQDYVAGVNSGLASGAPQINTGLLATPFSQIGDQMARQAISQGSTAVQQYVSGINKELGNVQAAVQKLNETLNTGLSQASSKARTAATNIGKNIANGVAAGIRQGRSGVINAAVSMVKAAVNAAKKEADINSPSKVFEEEVGKNMALGVAVGLEENTDEATKAAVQLAKKTYEASRDYIDKEKYYNRLSLSDELLAWQRVQAQYVEGSQQRIDAEKEVYRTRKELLEKIEDLEENYQKQVASRAKDIAKGYDLFSEVKDGGRIETQDLMYNSAQQEAQLEEWTAVISELMDKAKELGLSDGFVEYLQGQDLNTLLAVARASDEQLITLSGRFDNINKMANQQATKELVGLREETDAQIADLLIGVEDQFTEYAPSLGKSLTDGMAEGIKDGMTTVVKAAVSVAQAAVRAVQNILEIHSPSRRFRWLGNMGGEGFAKGFADCINLVQRAAQSMANSALVPPNVVAGNMVTNNTTTVNHKETVVREKIVGVEFSGSGADLARQLKPALAKEENISGRSIVKRNRE